MAPMPFNPYASPRARIVVRETREPRAPGEALKWFYAGAFALTVSVCAAIVAVPFLPSIRGYAIALSLAVALLSWTKTAIAAVWIYSAWSGVPEAWRGPMTPRRAAFALFIPGYNLYWMYAVNPLLCGILNAVLERVSSPIRAPQTLAYVVSVLNVVVFVGLGLAWALHQSTQFLLVGLLATQFLWVAYLFQCDPARRAVIEAAHVRPSMFPPARPQTSPRA